MEDTDVHAAVLQMNDQSCAYETEGALRHAVSDMQRNLRGRVVRNYRLSTDSWELTFGSLKWPQLTDQHGRTCPDDPMIGRDDIPLAEFLAYVSDWYWPRRRDLEATNESSAKAYGEWIANGAPEPGGNVTVADEGAYDTKTTDPQSIAVRKAEARGIDLVRHAATSGNWGDLPRELAALQRVIMGAA